MGGLPQLAHELVYHVIHIRGLSALWGWGRKCKG